MSNISTAQARQYAQAAGFTGSGLDTIVAIATCESGLNPNNTNTVGNTPQGSVDRGILQFNSYWHKDVSDACAFNPACAFQQAYRVSQGGTNFNSWTTYKNGCASQKMGATLNASGVTSTSTGTNVNSALSSLPYGIGGAIVAVQTTLVNAVEEIGIFLLAIIIIILGVIILNTDEIKGLSHKVLA
jgi:Lysozyme like domain